MNMKIDRQILHVCLKLDDCNISLDKINSFLDGEAVDININDVTKLFVYYSAIKNHIFGFSGYNVCNALLEAMVLGSHGTLGFNMSCLKDRNNSSDYFRTARACENYLERAARIFVTVASNNLVSQHSIAFGYLMMVYSLKKDGYDLYVPTETFIEDMLIINDVDTYVVKVDRILNHLRAFYAEV